MVLRCLLAWVPRVYGSAVATLAKKKRQQRQRDTCLALLYCDDEVITSYCWTNLLPIERLREILYRVSRRHSRLSRWQWFFYLTVSLLIFYSCFADTATLQLMTWNQYRPSFTATPVLTILQTAVAPFRTSPGLSYKHSHSLLASSLTPSAIAIDSIMSPTNQICEPCVTWWGLLVLSGGGECPMCTSGCKPPSPPPRVIPTWRGFSKIIANLWWTIGSQLGMLLPQLRRGISSLQSLCDALSAMGAIRRMFSLVSRCHLSKLWTFQFADNNHRVLWKLFICSPCCIKPISS